MTERIPRLFGRIKVSMRFVVVLVLLMRIDQSRQDEVPTRMPTITYYPTLFPTVSYAPTVTAVPSSLPTGIPSETPTARPTPAPTALPSSEPSLPPTTSLPSVMPIPVPTATPSISIPPSPEPTYPPTPIPSEFPTIIPSPLPTNEPSSIPTPEPTDIPIPRPTSPPSALPSPKPTHIPSPLPTSEPSRIPTSKPTSLPTFIPSPSPTTRAPTGGPSRVPIPAPTMLPSPIPTPQPTYVPSPQPSEFPTVRPTKSPTAFPTYCPSPAPSARPSFLPTSLPTNEPSVPPTPAPSMEVSAGGSSSSNKEFLFFPSAAAAAGVFVGLILCCFLLCFAAFIRFRRDEDKEEDDEERAVVSNNVRDDSSSQEMPPYSRPTNGVVPTAQLPLAAAAAAAPRRRSEEQLLQTPERSSTMTPERPNMGDRGSTQPRIVMPGADGRFVNDDPDYFDHWDYEGSERSSVLRSQHHQLDSYIARRRGRVLSFSRGAPPAPTSPPYPHVLPENDTLVDGSLPPPPPGPPQTTIRVRWTEEDEYAGALVKRFERSVSENSRGPSSLPPEGGLADGEYLSLARAVDGFDVDGTQVDEELAAAIARVDIWTFQARYEAATVALAKLRIPHAQGRVELKVRRNTCFKGALKAYRQLALKGWRMSWFVKMHGEQGLDAGGISREFWRLTMDQAFSDGFGLFRRCTNAGTYDIADPAPPPVAAGNKYSKWGEEIFESPEDEAIRLRLEEYRFVGRGLAKMLFDGHGGCLGPSPNVKMLKLLVGEPFVFDDLQLVDEEIYLSLKKLKSIHSDHELRALMVTFSVSSQLSDGRISTTELCDRGADRSVHLGNVDEFVEARLRHAVFPKQHQPALTALVAGFHDVIPPSVTLLLTARELELALCGLPSIDLNDMQANTEYRGDFREQKESHPVCAAFWQTLYSWDDEKRARLLQWATGSAKLPVGGFANLQQRDGVSRKFTLTSVDRSSAVYPRAHTCFNRIDLPLYDNPDNELPDKLAFCIIHATGEFNMD